MDKSKIVNLVTKNALFSASYILIFVAVGIIALLTDGNIFWVKLSWAMLSVLGVFVTMGAYVSYQEAVQSKRWPKVSARLLSTHVGHQMGSGNGYTYTPSALYAFKFNGQDYQGSTIDYSAMSGSEAWAKKVISQLESQGNVLMVHVNPDNPDLNVLKPGIRMVHYLRYLIGPAMIVFGILYYLKILKL